VAKCEFLYFESSLSWQNGPYATGLVSVLANTGGLTGLTHLNKTGKLTVHCVIPLLTVFFLGLPGPHLSDSELFIGGKAQCTNEYRGIFTANDNQFLCLCHCAQESRASSSCD